MTNPYQEEKTELGLGGRGGGRSEFTLLIFGAYLQTIVLL